MKALTSFKIINFYGFIIQYAMHWEQQLTLKIAKTQEKIFGTKKRNQAKLEVIWKLWYLLWVNFDGYCQSFISGREAGH